MSKFIIFLVYVFSLTAISQTETAISQTENSYKGKMEIALSEKQDALKLKHLKQLSETFKNEWLPDYYLAETLIKNSMSSLYNEAELTRKLDEAQSYLDKAYKVEVNANDEAELLIMQAKLYMVYVMSNGAVYGRKYAPVMTNIYTKAYKLAPENPRVLLMKAQWEMGMASYFGESTEKFCTEFKKAKQLFNTFKISSSIHPNWGLDKAEQAVKSCHQ